MTIASLIIKIVPAVAIAYGLYELYTRVQVGLATFPF